MCVLGPTLATCRLPSLLSKPIYSQQLSNTTFSAAGTYTLYTVPAATTVVVTNIDYFVDDPVANEVSFVELKNCLVALLDPPALGNYTCQWVGRQVLNPGDTITFRTSGSAAFIGVTGYVLGP